MDEARKLLNEIDYLASLASQPSEVDIILDSVRRVTSHVGSELKPSDLSTLRNTKESLKHYLTTDEKVAIFTPESLEVRLQEHFGTKSRISHHLLIIIIICICLPIATSFIPLSPNIKSSLPPTVLNSALSLGGAYFFLISLSSFTKTVKKAYFKIGLGFVFAASSQIIVPGLILLLGPDNRGIAVIISCIILISIYFLYTGMRMYAKVTGTEGQLSENRTMALSVAGSTILSLALIFLIQPRSLVGDLIIILQGWTIAAFIVLALLVRIISRAVAVLYGKAAKAFLHALVLATLVSSFFFIYYVLLLSHSSQSLLPIFLAGQLVGTLACMLNLRAGYAFYRSSKY